MGKATFKGLVTPNDPMFNGGAEFFHMVDTPQEEPTRPPVTFVRRVSINWEGDALHLDLDEDSWSRIQTGQQTTLEVLDEVGELTYCWLFNVEPGYSLIVDFGDPNHLRWLGQVGDAVITEIKEIKGG
jgi:hypothetical protein